MNLPEINLYNHNEATIQQVAPTERTGGSHTEIPNPPFPVCYDPKQGQYFVQTSKGKWIKQNLAGLRRRLGLMNFPQQLEDQALVYIEDHLGVDYAGPLAGHESGIYPINGGQVLVTNSPVLIDPQPGQWTTIHALLNQMFVKGEDQSTGTAQWHTLIGWLRGSVVALRSGSLQQAQILVMAGPAKAGKSLLQGLITLLLGGRAAKAFRYMSGATQFNEELFEAEHLILEDESSDDSPRARKRIAAGIKQFTVSTGLQPMHGKGKKQVNLSPGWRVSVSVNDTPDALQVLPAMEPGVEDKIILLRATAFTMPMPTGTDEEKKVFFDQLVGELPHFLYWLIHKFQSPEACRDNRFQVKTWHHPALLEKLQSISKEARLLALIDDSFWTESYGQRQPWSGTARDLREQLLQESKADAEERKLIENHTHLGMLLGSLAKEQPSRVREKRTAQKRGWIIIPPPDDTMPPESEA